MIVSCWPLNVICCKTAIRLESGQKRKGLARTQNGADDPQQTFNSSPLVIELCVEVARRTRMILT